MQLDPDAESRQRLRLLRGEAIEEPQENKTKGKAQYRTAQDDLRDAKLKAEAEAAVRDEEAEQPEADGAEARKEDGNAVSSEEESDAGGEPNLLIAQSCSIQTSSSSLKHRGSLNCSEV